jgi:hypothetical protein
MQSLPEFSTQCVICGPAAHDDTAKSGSKAARANKSLMGEADVMALGSIVNESEAAQMSMAVRLSLTAVMHVDRVLEFGAFSTHT